MKDTILAQVMALKSLSTGELLKKYEELFGGKKAPSSNKTYLWRKIAYRIQELEYGGLSEEAQNRVNELIEEYDPINNKILRPNNTFQDIQSDVKQIHPRDRRLPIPGTIITKEYKGSPIQVKVLDRGFEYKNKIYRSLTAVAKDVTGAHWNGYLFFNL